VSVIVPTRDRPAQLADCLDHLARLQRPAGGFEVIVVDDGGSVPLEPLLATFRPRLDLIAIDQEHAGPARARNAGAARARGRQLVFLDDDCRPEPGWLAALADGGDGTARGGRVVNAFPDVLCSAASQMLCDYLYAYYNGNGSPRFFTSNNLTLERDLFGAIGGFDPSFTLAAGEDRDLCDRLLRAGVPLRYVPDAVVRHAHRLGPWAFVCQHFRYGRGALVYHRTRQARGGGRVRVEPPRFYAGMIRYPFRASAPRRRAAAIAGLLVFSQLANAAGFGWEALGRPSRRAPLSRPMRAGDA
jgi:GT2 family glycosyltransferase